MVQPRTCMSPSLTADRPVRKNTTNNTNDNNKNLHVSPAAHQQKKKKKKKRQRGIQAIPTRQRRRANKSDRKAAGRKRNPTHAQSARWSVKCRGGVDGQDKVCAVASVPPVRLAWRVHGARLAARSPGSLRAETKVTLGRRRRTRADLIEDHRRFSCFGMLTGGCGGMTSLSLPPPSLSLCHVPGDGRLPSLPLNLSKCLPLCC